MENDKKLYTAGIFAKKAGITLKTIHYYHKEGLLVPSEYNEAGYRLYSEQDFEKLQKILTLKFIGFSLAEIKQLIKADYLQNNAKESFSMQRDIIDEKIKHLSLVKKAIDEAEVMIDNSEVLDWKGFVNIIKVINMEKIWMNQYKNASNLSSRIQLHDLYSTNKYGWHRWFYDQLEFKKGIRILEIGCGNASLWERNLDRVPEGCDIILTDISEGMIEDAKKNLVGCNNEFKFEVADAQKLPYEDNSFDIVIANHMLYHVPNRKKAFYEIHRVLKAGGVLYSSTIGKNHLKELKSLLKEFNPKIIISETDFSEEFGLENGDVELSDWFAEVELKRYEDYLIVTKVQPLIDYVCSTTGNTKEFIIGENLKNFKKFLEDKMVTSNHIYISKDTGVFKANKAKQCS
jgi:ubiquinone/menaquinone biosynthesis C-methylase UbiE/DNA-binding transcriptional MerR regulator